MDTCGSFEEFAHNSLGQLKDYLSARGLSCTGNKEQLVARCFVAWESGTPLKFTEEQQVGKLNTEYTTRLEKAGIKDPRSYPDSEWSDDVKLWPKVNLGLIFSFILRNKEHDIDFVGRYKTQKAYSYYESGFVNTIKSKDINHKVVIKSQVTPSMSIRNDPHEVWICLESEHTDIITCWCSCIAGMAQTCNHVIAVLYKLEYASSVGFNDPACTSLPCGWNSSTKKRHKAM